MFYLVGGVVASLTHIFFNPGSQVPTVGASGAIAAVLGAYLVLYPQSRVMTIIPLGFFIRLASIPAIIVLGFWFILQLFNGVFSLGAESDVGGVAFWAHIGGFVSGLVLAKLLASRRRKEYAVRW
jgi:membrane associated rhomboid family serine protease